MERRLEVVLTEKDVNEIIKKHIENDYCVDVSSLTFSTGVRGDYDRGNAIEFVRTVTAKIE